MRPNLNSDIKFEPDKDKKEHHGLTADLLQKESHRFPGQIITTVILLSFIFGIAGAFFGSYFVVPFYKNQQSGLSASNDMKFVQVTEQSAVVDVVKRANDAVVSIIISKDLNKIPGYSSAPFDFGPFSFDPFFSFRNPTDTSEPNYQVVGRGSGFFISKNGLIATNKHVVSDEAATYVVLTNDGKNHEATVLSVDPINDLALLKIEGEDFPTLDLGDSSKLEIGQKVIAIGNSLGHQNTVTTGIVSGIGRTIIATGTFGSEQIEGVIQTDAAINPGNSGGPLLDIGGSVIGINTAVDAQGQLIGFAIPVNDLVKDIKSFEKFGKIVKPFLGVRYVLINETIKQQNKLPVDYGALIVKGDNADEAAVAPGSAADQAGIKEGDIILEINGQKVDQDRSLAGILKDYDPGDVVKMKVLSQGTEKEIPVTLGETK